VGGSLLTLEENKAFRNGLNLSCMNGFKLSDVSLFPLLFSLHCLTFPTLPPKLLPRYPGGALGLLHDIQGSKIQSFLDIKLSLNFIEPDVDELPFIPHHSYGSMADVITSFLQGTGIPPSIDPKTYALDLDGMGAGGPTSLAFRPSMFLKAATGTDHLQRGSTVQGGFVLSHSM
jgi:hypothetical protein